jgi:hypothetical protein
MGFLGHVAKQVFSFVRFILFVVLSTFRGFIVTVLRFLAPWFVIGGAVGLFAASAPEHWQLSLGALAVGVSAAMLAHGYDRLLLALQPRGTDIALID